MSDSHSRPVRTRYAPSPTGLPHVGNLRNALYSWLLARRHGGQFVFRLEDTDRERYSAEAERALHEALAWFGLGFDEGPGVGGPFGPYVQSERLERYREVAEQLIATGHAYRCYCTRERVQEVRDARQKAQIHPFGYDRHCRELSAEERARNEAEGRPYVVRFAAPLEGETQITDAVRGSISYPNRELDDHVLLKSDGFPTYHLAVVVDDHDMQITHVIRSEEWIPSTPRHVLTYQALDWEAPVFVHPALIMGRDPQSGKISKLSKRHGSTNVDEYREKGFLPEALANYLALLGWSPGGDRELMTLSEMAELFSLEGVNASPSIFDPEKLTWMNGVYIRGLSESELVERCLPYLRAAGVVGPELSSEELEYLSRILKLEQERIKTLAETPALTDFFFGELPEYDPAAVEKRLRKPGSRAALDAVLSRLEQAVEWNLENVESAVRGAIDALGVKSGEVIHPVRVAATGRMVGPGLFEALWVLGRDRTLARLRHAQAQLAE